MNWLHCLVDNIVPLDLRSIRHVDRLLEDIVIQLEWQRARLKLHQREIVGSHTLLTSTVNTAVPICTYYRIYFVFFLLQTVWREDSDGSQPGTHSDGCCCCEIKLVEGMRTPDTKVALGSKLPPLPVPRFIADAPSTSNDVLFVGGIPSAAHRDLGGVVVGREEARRFQREASCSTLITYYLSS